MIQQSGKQEVNQESKRQQAAKVVDKMKVGYQNAKNQKQSANHVQYKVIDSGPFVPSKNCINTKGNNSQYDIYRGTKFTSEVERLKFGITSARTHIVLIKSK